MPRPKLKPFDKYEHYLKSVQSPDVDSAFLAKTFKDLRGRPARTFREDFCGTHMICCEWVKAHKDNYAYGVDLDLEPILYGQRNYASRLTEEQRSRMHILKDNVLSVRPPKVDIINALNFSFYIFKSRTLLRKYFENCLKGLNSKGLLIVDAFGGSSCYEPNEDKARISSGKFFYFWEQKDFDPITNEAIFYIHFKRDGERKRQRVFKYDWRMWTIPEIREVMMEAGFRRTHVYWEGTTARGLGDGKFRRKEKGESCQGWVAYVVGEI